MFGPFWSPGFSLPEKSGFQFFVLNGLPFFPCCVQFIQPLDKEQIGHLLNDFHGVGYTAGPERIPYPVDLTPDRTCYHSSFLHRFKMHEQSMLYIIFIAGYLTQVECITLLKIKRYFSAYPLLRVYRLLILYYEHTLCHSREVGIPVSYFPNNQLNAQLE